MIRRNAAPGGTADSAEPRVHPAPVVGMTILPALLNSALDNENARPMEFARVIWPVFIHALRRYFWAQLDTRTTIKSQRDGRE